MKNAKKIFAIITVIFAVFSLCFCSSGGSGTETVAEYNTTGTVVETVEKDETQFSKADVKTVETDADSADATITLSGSSGTISDTTRGTSGSSVEITTKGTYYVSGHSENASIVISDAEKSGNIYLYFDNVSMVNTERACVFVRSADKVVIYLVGENALSSSMTEEYTDAISGANIDGAIFSKDDLTINGDEGATLSVTSSMHGIVAKDDLKITGGTIGVTATKKGLDINDSLRIGGGDISVDSGRDGVQIENDEGTAYFYMDGGKISVVAGYDGINVKGANARISLVGGTADITAPAGGSRRSKSSSVSQKGLKCDGDIIIGNASLTVSSADDAIHSGATISVAGGALDLSSSDDGIHADSTISVSGGEITVKKSYEAIEAFIIEVKGGKISVTASDDGLNAAGDTQSGDTDAYGWRNTSSSGTLTISGGEITVNCSGDGLDSNGKLSVSGGTVYVFGPSSAGNSALDSDGGTTVSGGTLVAICREAMDKVSFAQPAITASVSLSAGAAVSVGGVEFTMPKAYSGCTVFVTSPDFQSGSSYTFSYGSQSVSVTAATGSFGGQFGGGGPGGNPGGGPFGGRR